MVSTKTTQITATTVVVDGKPVHTVFALSEDGVVLYTDTIADEALKSTKWRALPVPVKSASGNVIT